jgi:hypothetical protein
MVPVGGYLAWVVVRGEANRWRFDLGRHGSEREAWAVCERHAAAPCSERGAELVPAVKRQQRKAAAAEPAGVLRVDS